MAITLTRMPDATPPPPGRADGGYRLALDLGTNSIGWCLLDLDAEERPVTIRGLGSRIFSDGRNPKDGASLAVARRLARQMRRRRDRYVQRRTRFLNALARHGLMPQDRDARKKLETMDPYDLRARGVSERLEPNEIGRALFHLNQRRGFQSNRVVDKEDEKEAGKIKTAISDLEGRLTGHRSLGAFLYERERNGEGTRARTHGDGATASYDFYVHRDMVAREFDALWERQQAFHPSLLTEEARSSLRGILCWQRPLKPVKPGRCTLEPTDERAPWALPIAQRFRILQELNHLSVQAPGTAARPLTLAERNTLRDALLGQKDLDFKGMRKRLDLPEGQGFQAGMEKRGRLLGDETAARLRHKARFGKAWDALTPEAQTEVVTRLLSDPDENGVVAWLRDRFDLRPDRARAVAGMRLPDGHAHFGARALAKVVPQLEAAVVPLSRAVELAGYDPHYRPEGPPADRLDYYGRPLERYVAFGTGDPDDPEEKRFGRIANPTVHVALNQVRKLVNAVIERHGNPDQIVVELARDLKSSKRQKDEYEQQRRENEARNERHVRMLGDLGQENNGENRLRLRLWEELGPDPLDRRCVYTGKQISPATLFSPEVEVDHILPFSRTLDDGAGNKTVSLRRANRAKAQQTPQEAFGHSPSGYEWEAIVGRAATLPPNKRWRFAPDAMERFEADEGFLARHLNDTRYLSRLAKQYLCGVCAPNRVWVTPGRLTEMLRGKWGVNKLLGAQDAKNRNDHRHHAIDAAVVGVTDRRLLQLVATAAAQAETRGAGRVLESLPLPWPEFYRDLEARLGRVVVSHKPEHGVAGQLHEETAYGKVSGPNAKGYLILQARKPLAGMTKPGDLEDIADGDLRERLTAATVGMSGAVFKQAVATFSQATGIRRVRVRTKKKEAAVVPVGHPAYKLYPSGSNYCVEIVEAAKGSRSVWEGEFITTFEANQRPYREFRKDEARFRTTTFSGRPLVMRLIAGDAVALERREDPGRRTIWRVVKLNATNSQLVLAPHQEGGALDKRHRASCEEDPFTYLFKTPNALSELKARRVFVDILGRVKDPGWGDDRTDRGNRPGGAAPAHGARVPGGAGGA